MAPKNSFMDSYKLFWDSILDFEGRTRRSDFWQPLLINAVIAAVLLTVFRGRTVQFLIELVLGLVSLSSCIRRLHDIGKKGTWILIGLIPLAGAIILIVWYAQDSYRGINEFGPSPKYIDAI
ncbi:MAG: DUF805 domain-containing protein [Oscillospiraceae bacterium]|nr:DUF805 domain-containing protein [Oscillospiraceae bacterium]